MDWLLFIHIAGAILFLGNVITAAFWKLRADASGEPKVIHSAARNVMLADWVFTLPGLVMIIVSGNLMAHHAGYFSNGFNWLILSLILFSITGVIWVGLLIPLQLKMIKLSGESTIAGKITNQYKRVSTYWAIFGVLATLLPFGVLYFMIMKGF